MLRSHLERVEAESLKVKAAIALLAGHRVENLVRARFSWDSQSISVAMPYLKIGQSASFSLLVSQVERLVEKEVAEQSRCREISLSDIEAILESMGDSALSKGSFRRGALLSFAHLTKAFSAGLSGDMLIIVNGRFGWKRLSTRLYSYIEDISFFSDTAQLNAFDKDDDFIKQFTEQSRE